MSGGSPVAGGLMRQRHNSQGGYASSGDDLEDDACSRAPAPFPVPQARTWTETMENVLWIASTIFIIYFGDRRSNFIYILWHDDRIRRAPLYIGMVGVFLNFGIFSYMNLLAWGIRKTDEKLEVIAPSLAPLVTLLGIVSFCLFSIALWPIWSFLSLPLLFTLFMACMVISPFLMFGKFRQPIDVFRPRWGRYYVGPIQFAVCYGAVVGCTLLGGQCMKSIYLISSPDGNMKLYQFVVIFGGLLLILAQVPSFHSLRHINLVSLLLCLAYSTCATAGSIYIGSSSKGPSKDYSLSGTNENRVFGVFNAIAIIATTFGNGIIPEIQATLAPPVKGKMFKGLCVCYTVVTITFFTVAISGYWAFGNQAAGIILTNFMDNAKHLLPKWFLLMTYALTLLQLSAVAVVYLQPTNEVLERTLADPKKHQFSVQNVLPRLISRTLSVAIATTIAAMLPFFGDINSLLGAFGFIPLDFVLPAIFFNVTFRPSKRGLLFWLNATIAIVFSVMGVIAAVAAVRQITLDAKTYKLFANV